MKYHIISFGCQFNQADAERAATVLEKIGYEKTSNFFEADLVLVFACSVRQSAIDRIVGLKTKFRQIKKLRPVITILSGCVLKTDNKKLSVVFDLIIPNTDLPKLPLLLKKKVKNLPDNYLKIHPSYQSAFQACVPIMTGCNNFCAYCVVPYTRGRETSRKAKDVLFECQDLIKRGYKEIILIGQNVNSYADGKYNFPKLLKAVDGIKEDYWLSFATSHPKDLSDNLLKTMSQGKHIMPYLHLPVQAGDDEILRRMNRRYTAKHYINLIKKARRLIPEINISTDVIVGFPGETKKQFLNTAKLFKTVKYDMAYLAQYSPRVGTAAAKFDDNVVKPEKKRREEALNDILRRTANERNQVFVGRNIKVLVESFKDGFCYGRTWHFKNIRFPSPVDYSGQFVIVKVISAYAWGLNGKLPKVLVVLGTTASGKTKLAVSLARKLKGEIISADSRQVYRDMDIGSGKDLKEYGMVPHHLIDIADPKKQLTAPQWQKMARQKIQEILSRQNLPIVCGGTGLYLSALTEGYTFTENQAQNNKWRQKLNKLTLKQLLKRLQKIDIKTYNLIDKNNRRRVQRALEIFYLSGKPKSETDQKNLPPYQFIKIGLTYPRETLNHRIEKRLIQRLEKEGMINEVKRLHQRGVSWQRLESFGLEYRFLAQYLQKKTSYEEMVPLLNRAIADFAKRQMTWFKRDKEIIWTKDIRKIITLLK